jgi:hypothetical protein
MFRRMVQELLGIEQFCQKKVQQNEDTFFLIKEIEACVYII